MQVRSAQPGAVESISADQIRELSLARRRAARVRRAANVAAFNGWTTAAFALLSLAGAIFSLESLFAAGILAVLARNELAGCRRLRRFDGAATVLLGFNQVAFGVLLIAYSAWKLWQGLTHPGSMSQAMLSDPLIAEQLGATITGLERLTIIALYGSLAGIGLIVPGLTALYYFTRGHHVRAFVAATPDWAVRALRAAA